jgi:membrane protein
LFGAEFDAELERARELEAGIRAEETLQLPPRDTTVSDKAAKRLEEDIAEGRRLRLAAAHPEPDRQTDPESDSDTPRDADSERQSELSGPSTVGATQPDRRS